MPYIDDKDSSIQYSTASDDWHAGGSPSEFLSTTQQSHRLGAKATVVFYGTTIEVFGTIQSIANSVNGSTGPVSTYTIDGAPAVTFSGTPQVSNDIYQQQFFNSGLLADGRHTLVIQNMLQGPVLCLDYLHYTASSTCLTAPVTQTVQCSGTAVGETVGAAIGSCVFTLLCGFALFYLIRGRRRKPSHSKPEAQSIVDPYDLSLVQPTYTAPASTTAGPSSAHSLFHYTDSTPPPYNPTTSGPTNGKGPRMPNPVR
ncbi:hypothetical protein C8J56DRAFT_1160513 [Mycena floridula]|nr:hypothetical protein C8J56DRAFT_1160513 [Mycena floridula]